jgi:hypothetical protein
MRKRWGTGGLTIGAGALALCLGAIGAPAASAAPPTIVRTTVSNVSTEAVTLGALVNPQGQEGAYRFEYGPTNCSLSACTQVPGGSFPAGTSPAPVTPVLLEGLTPGTTYHLRVVLTTNLDGETAGPDRVFSTYVPAFEGLPDGRAYEQASPVKKNAADARGTVVWARAADDGNRISFLSSSGLPGGAGQQNVPAYLASRGDSDWSTQGLLPPAALGSEAYLRGWLPDLSAVFEQVTNLGAGEDALFLSRESADGSLTEVLGHGDGLGAFSYAGASADGAKILFEANAKLPCCPQALAGKPNLYLWDRGAGQIRLVGVLNGAPNEEAPPPAGAVAGPYDWMKSSTLPLAASGGGSTDSYYTQDTHAISAGAEAVYFTAEGSGALYVRLNPTAPQSPLDGEGNCQNPALACTLEVSATHRTPPDKLGPRPAAFMVAIPDGKSVFFASPEELTEDANTGPPQPPPLIQRAASSGPPIEESQNLKIIATGIAKDAEHLYWVNPPENAIGRSDLDGGNADPSFIEIPARTECPSNPLGDPNCFANEEKEVPANPQYVAVDAEHVYWTSERSGNKGVGTIGRAEIDGTPQSIEDSIEAEWITGATRPKGIALDDEYVYWANAGAGFGGEGTIGRAEKSNPGNPEQEFIEGNGTHAPQGIAVDAGHIYWSTVDPNGNGGSIRRTDLDGLDQKFRGLVTGVQTRGIALDSEYVYWASQGKEAIGRMPIADFTQVGGCEVIPNCELNFIPVPGKPTGLAADGAHLRWSVNGEVVPNPGNDLYRYRPEGEELEDLTALAGGNGAEVKGVLGASADGKRVYFVANGDLDGAGEAHAGDCKGPSGAFFIFTGRCSLYLAQETAPNSWSTTFIAPLGASGDCDVSDAMSWLGKGGGPTDFCWFVKSAQVSADGGVLLFRSHEQLSAYDNEGLAELYRYDADADELGCVSCNPSGEAPSGSARLSSIGLTAFPPQSNPAFVLARNLSADGERVFFESTDPMVVDDANGKASCKSEGPGLFPFRSCQDVYEWVAEGSGSCAEDVQGGGCLYLLSSAGPSASFFADASLSGDDAFIATRAAGLVGQDQDELQDVYDARVDGGLPSQNKVPVPECESLDGCHGPQSPPPASQSPPTANLGGPGNVKHARKGAKKHHKRKKHRKHKRRQTRQQTTGGKSR